ncbi:MAG: hypothetical protein P1U40_01095 [Coxiellaceae bacterium]|nr:hypothetical protein [Coxiellaceae bacterium]
MRKRSAEDPFIIFKSAKHAELVRHNAAVKSHSNTAMFFSLLSIFNAVSFLDVTKLFDDLWKQYAADYQQALFGYSQQRYEERLSVFTDAVSSAFSMDKSLALAERYGLSDSVTECMAQLAPGGVAHWVTDAESVKCYSDYLNELIPVFKHGEADTTYKALDHAYRRVLKMLGQTLVDREAIDNAGSLAYLASGNEDPDYLRNLQRNIFALLPKFFSLQETLEGKLVATANDSFEYFLKSAATAFAENKTLLVCNMALLLLAGVVAYGCTRTYVSSADPVKLTGEKKDDQAAIEQYSDETKKKYKPASTFVTWALGSAALSLCSMFVYLALRHPKEDFVNAGGMALLSTASFILTPLIYNPVVNLFVSDEKRHAEKKSKQIIEGLADKGLYLTIDIEQVTTDKQSQYFLTLSYRGKRLTDDEVKGMMRYVSLRDAQYGQHMQHVNGKIIIHASVNVKSVKQCFNAYWQLSNVSFDIFNMLQRINKRIYHNRGFEISALPATAAQGDSFGICYNRLLRFRSETDVDINKLQLVFPESEITVNPENPLEVSVVGLSQVNQHELRNWVQEVVAQRPEREPNFVEEHRPSMAASVVRRTMTGAAARRVAGAGDFDDAPVVAQQPERAAGYPDEFEFNYNGATQTAHLVEGRRSVVPAYVAVLLQEGPTYRTDVVEAIQQWVSPARWGSTVRSIQGTNLAADCTNPQARTKQLKGKASFEVRAVKKGLSDYRGICRREGMFPVTGRGDLNPVEVHFCVDVRRHASKGRGFK